MQMTAERPRETERSKDLLRFITCGSVDDGKSTLIGRLLHDSKLILEDQLSSLIKDSAQHGAAGEDIDFSLLVDGLEAEREQGITIDVAYRFFATARRSFIVADTPGHEQYTRNMATGASTAQLADHPDRRAQGRPDPDAAAFAHLLAPWNTPRHRGGEQDGSGRFPPGYFRRHRRRLCGVCRQDEFRLHYANSDLGALRRQHHGAVRTTRRGIRARRCLQHLETIEPQSDGADAASFRFPVQWVNRLPGFPRLCGHGRVRQDNGRRSDRRRHVRAGLQHQGDRHL